MARRGVRMVQQGFALSVPPGGVHDLTEEVTAERHLFSVTHMGVAEIDRDEWRLEIGGLVERPQSLAMGDLASLPPVDLRAVHECAGSPLTPREPKRRVGNVVWSGVRLDAVLERTGVRPAARFVWSEGLEWGEFAGIRDEPYVKDLPLAETPRAILATHLNGALLPARHGAPVRLVVPGWYGTNSVKWLGRLTLADRRAPGPFTTRFYNDPGPDGPIPVWGIAPECILVRPSPSDLLPVGRAVELEGWAWGEREIARVEVRVGDGDWRAARLDRRVGHAWQAFSSVVVPATPGPWRLSCRCFDASGRGQPDREARNAIHALDLNIVA